MKTNPLLITRLILAFPALIPFSAYGQETSKPTADGNILKETADDEVSIATGSIFSVEVDALSLTPEKSAIPLVFETTSETPMVDEQDKPVARDLVRKGIAATVHYTTVGKKLIATKVTFTRETLTGATPGDPTGAAIKRAEITETKAMKEEARAKALLSEGGGTLMGFEQILTVRTPGQTTVTQYTVNNSTLYVDSAGNPVPPHAVRTGVGLNVQFVEDAGRKIATRVTIQTMPAWVREGLLTAESGGTGVGTGGAPNGRERRVQTDTTLGDLSDAFIYPPINSLPAVQLPGTVVDGTNGQTGTTSNGQTNPPAQPNANQPNANRTTPGRTTQPGRGTPSTPSQPSTPPASPGAKP